MAVEDEAVARIVGGNADRHTISGDDADPEPAHGAAELRREGLTVFEPDDEISAAAGLGHGAFEIRQIVLRQGVPAFPFLTIYHTLAGNARAIGGIPAIPPTEWDIMLARHRMENLTIDMPEAILFDFDGILVDSEPLHYRAFIEVLDPLGMGFPWEEYVETYMGFDDRDAFREAFRAKGIDLDEGNLAKLVAAKSRAFLDGIRTGMTAYPGVVPLIESLRAASRPMALCSGALRADIDPILAQLGVAGRFDVIVSADDVHRSKPDPESYALAFRNLSERYRDSLTVPENSVAVEDTPAGIRSAKGAGLRVLAVTNSYDPEDLTEADWIIDSLENVRFEG